MNNPQQNIRRCVGPDITADLVLVFEQIDEYKRLELRKLKRQLAALGKADTDDEPDQTGA